jgi:RNA:NAD 2'-phosphotransferase (TPT1/KptA family)
MSSAHVYLRLNKNERLEDVAPGTIMECAQLVKANSIEGCKLNHVHISENLADNNLKVFYDNN